jgi:flagellar basal-body rod protein FlgB
MAVTDLPLVAMLKTRLHWHQTRQKLLAENVANADTPGFKPKELKAPGLAPARGAVAVSVERTTPPTYHLRPPGRVRTPCSRPASRSPPAATPSASRMR